MYIRTLISPSGFTLNYRWWDFTLLHDHMPTYWENNYIHRTARTALAYYSSPYKTFLVQPMFWHSFLVSLTSWQSKSLERVYISITSQSYCCYHSTVSLVSLPKPLASSHSDVYSEPPVDSVLPHLSVASTTLSTRPFCRSPKARYHKIITCIWKHM